MPIRSRRINQGDKPPSGPNGQTPHHIIAIIAGAALFVCFSCCGIGAYISSRKPSVSDKQLAEADKLWNAGQKTSAVESYKSVLESGASDATPRDSSVESRGFPYCPTALPGGGTDAGRAWAASGSDG